MDFDRQPIFGPPAGAPDPGYVPPREEFTAGRVIGRSFAIWLRNIVPFTILVAIVYSPLILYTAVVFKDEASVLDHGEMWERLLPAMEVGLGMVASGALAYGVFQQLRGEPAGVFACLGVGLSRLFPVLGVGILFMIIVVLGLIALIVPGIILASIYWVAVPVAVIERPGVFASMRRSKDLTAGRRLGVAGIIIVFWLIDKAAGKGIEKMMTGSEVQDLGDVRVRLMVAAVVVILLAGWSATATALGYHDLRNEKEGVQAVDLAKVFD